MIETSRRLFLRGLGVILPVPAIVTASNLMPISSRQLNVGVVPANEIMEELIRLAYHWFIPRALVQAYTDTPLLRLMRELDMENTRGVIGLL